MANPWAEKRTDKRNNSAEGTHVAFTIRLVRKLAVCSDIQVERTSDAVAAVHAYRRRRRVFVGQVVAVVWVDVELFERFTVTVTRRVALLTVLDKVSVVTACTVIYRRHCHSDLQTATCDNSRKTKPTTVWIKTLALTRGRADHFSTRSTQSTFPS